MVIIVATSSLQVASSGCSRFPTTSLSVPLEQSSMVIDPDNVVIYDIVHILMCMEYMYMYTCMHVQEVCSDGIMYISPWPLPVCAKQRLHRKYSLMHA